MKLSSAALLFLASFGATISSSHAKMVEFQVSSDGETNKKNGRKLQGDVTVQQQQIKCNDNNLVFCKKNCEDLYCKCADACGWNNGVGGEDSDDCKVCVATNGEEKTLSKCKQVCQPCHNINHQEKLQAASTKAPASTEAPRTRFLNDGDNGFNFDEFFDCKDEPSMSPIPSMSPSVSSAPSTSAAPTTDCGIIDCDMTHSASCNPDPHYSVWSGTLSFYDFQGSCDQIAIDNSNLQLQIKTRGRGNYSTITEVALKMKASDELLQVDGIEVNHNITTASLGADVTEDSNYVKVTFPTPAGDSYIRINLNTYGISIQVLGIGYIFGGSEGMLGSWDNGGVNFQNGTAFDLSGGYADVKARSFELAEDWSVPSGSSNYLPNPSDTCVPESDCVAGDTDAPCDSSTRRLEDVDPGCDKSCFETALKDMCFTDLALSSKETPCKEKFALDSFEIIQCYKALESKEGVDKTWACQPTYVDPIIVPESLANFRPQGSEMCMADDDTCARLGGYCAPDCVDGPGTVCLEGLCSSAKPMKEMKEEYDRRLKKGKKDDREKMPKASKTTKSPKGTKSPKSKCMCKVQV